MVYIELLNNLYVVLLFTNNYCLHFVVVIEGDKSVYILRFIY